MTPLRNPDPDPETVLREMARVERLALAIVRDPQTAQDVAQDTLLVALQRPPRADGPHRFAWLARVTRSLAARHHRDARRRAVHERLAARPETDDEQERSAARLQLRRELLTAVAELPEPYRAAVTMRFLDAMPPRLVAAAMHVDRAAVRQRIHRGLQMLRARFARRREDGTPAFTSLPSLAGVTGTWSVPVLPFVAMNKTIAGIAAAALLTLGLAPILIRRDPPQLPAVAAAQQHEPATAMAAPETPTRADATAPDAPPDRGRSAAIAATGSLRVFVRVRGGPPLRAAIVSVLRTDGSRNGEPEVARRATTADGEARFDALTAGIWSVFVDGRGNPGPRVANGIAVRAGAETSETVEIEPGFTLTGTVVDAGGLPVPGARIVVDSAVGAATDLAEADLAGNFRIEQLQGPLTVRGRCRGHLPSPRATVTAAPGEIAELTLQLGARARVVEGRVVAADGAALAAASVALVPAAELTRHRWEQNDIEWLRTEDDGRFRCEEVAAGEFCAVAQARDARVPPCWAAVAPTVGDAFVELRARPAARIAGIVRRSGEPVAGVELIAWPAEDAARAALVTDLGWRHARSGADGTFELLGLADGPHVARVIEANAKVLEVSLVTSAGATCPWDPVLAPTGELHIDVHGATWPALAAIVRPAGVPATDLSGVLRLGDRSAATWTGARTEPLDVYLVSFDNKEDMVQVACRRAVPPDAARVEFTLTAQQLPVRWLRGRFVDERLAPVAMARAVACRIDGDGLVVRRTGGADAEGRFAIGPLPPGDYELRDAAIAADRVLARTFVGADQDADVADVTVRGRR